MSIDLNTSPYFDDYNSSKDYYKILFTPGKPVQARELTQMQSILQEQIKRHGDHVFKNGTMVIPGHVFYDNKVQFLKLDKTHNQIDIESYMDQLVGKTIVGQTNGLNAIVLHYDNSTATDAPTVYIKYTTGNGTVKTFMTSEVIACPEVPGLSFKIQAVTSYTGNAAICTIGDGVFYVNKYFVHVAKQIVTVSKYSSTNSAIVGLNYIESIVTENDDDSLYDNAFGFSNFGAPGAHRLHITLTLTVKPYDYTSADSSDIKFIDLLKIKGGAIEYLKNDTKYAELEAVLARRTYEESGDYTVRPYSLTLRNLRSNNRGQWITNTPYLVGDIVVNNARYYIALNQGYSGTNAPVQTHDIQSDGVIYWNEIPNTTGLLNDGAINIGSPNITDHIETEALMEVEVSPGKAYVQGFEVEHNNATKTVIPKARETKQLNQTHLYAPAGAYVVVNTITGVPNLDTSLTKLNILSVSGSTIGTAWARSLEWMSGTAPNAQYKLFIFDIKMKEGNNFSTHAHSFVSVVGGIFSANISHRTTALSGSISSNGTTVSGTGSYFNFEILPGQRVRAISPDGNTITHLTVTSVTSPTAFVASAHTSIVAGSTYFLLASDIIKLGDYVTKLNHPSINTVRREDGAIDMEYTVTKQYTFTSSGTTHAITLTNGETFLPSGHILVNSAGAAINPGYSLNESATVLTISGLSTSSYKFLAVVKRSGVMAKEKTKSLATKTITLTNSGTQTYANKVISLTEADCIRLIKVTESGDPTNKTTYVSTGEVNITNFFTFFNGQKPEYYDVGKIATNRANNRPLRITFEYFAHSSGDYFSADSYASTPDALIQPVTLGGVQYNLQECLDFRGRISDDGTSFEVSAGASVSDPILSNSTLSTSYSYFLPRTDVLGIATNGKLSYVVGGDKFNDGMKVATLTISPYTAKPAVDVKVIDNQIYSYTMKDINNINTRLNDIEYYVSLSLLESNTLKNSIKDEFGLEKDKNGYLVDSFVDHKTVDITNKDHMSAIDFEAQVCRALCSINNIDVTEPIGSSTASRLANGYQVTGSLITLPYTEEVMISQNIASKAELIQAYASIDFTGQMIIYPDADNYTYDRYNTNVTYRTLPNINISHSTTSYTYGATYRKTTSTSTSNEYRYWWAREQTSTTKSSASVRSNTQTSSSKSDTSVSVRLNEVKDETALAPSLRARTLVMRNLKLKPHTTMNLFISGVAANAYFVPCTKVQINTSSGSFIGGESTLLTDNQNLRATPNFNTQRNGFQQVGYHWVNQDSNPLYNNYYDVIARGEIIKCTTGSAVVVSDETTYDLSDGQTKRILYVINVKGTISGTVTGQTSLATSAVLAVSQGNMTTNSRGNLYGAFAIPSDKYLAGKHKILVSDSVTANLDKATTYADTGYSSQGIINTHTHNLAYDTQTTIVTTTNTNVHTQTTETTNVHTTTYSTWWWGWYSSAD